MANIIHRRSFDKGILDTEALLLMRVNMNKLPAHAREVVGNTVIGPNKIKEQDMVWFADGYVTMETPRTAMLTRALREVCNGFALALVNGKILKTYKKNEAQAAYDDLGRVSTSIDVSVLINDDSEADSASEDE